MPSYLGQLYSNSAPFNLEAHHFSKLYRPLPFLSDLTVHRSFQAICNVLTQQRDELNEWAESVVPGACVTLLWKNAPPFVNGQFLVSVCNLVSQDMRPDLAIGVLDEQATARIAHQRFGPSLDKYVVFGFAKIHYPAI